MFDCPSLEQLSLSFVDFTTKTNLVHNVPALRHLALSPSHRIDLQDEFVSSLAPQLATVSPRLSQVSHTYLILQRFANVQTLYSCDVNSAVDVTPSRAAKIQHLRLTSSRKFGQVAGKQETRDLGKLNDWLDLLHNNVMFHPGSIYLPSVCSPSNPALLPSIRDVVQSILSICDDLSVDVIFDEESIYIYHAMDSPISVDFVKRTEEHSERLKEKEKGAEARRGGEI
ncbi:hypothetical protein JCM5353_006825 [Sporobolomyces roseus]